MADLVLGAVGAAAGFAVGGPAGAKWGWAIGSALGGLVGGQPDGPGPGDLTAPQINLGSQIPRVYARVRCTVYPVWTSAFRPTEVSAGGGKGSPEGPSGYTYSLDMFGLVADGLNVVAVTRIWVNKKLVYTALADSDDASLAASTTTDYWEEFEFFDGNAAQVPWAVYETAVTTAKAVAYRHQCTVGITGLQCGGSKTPPLVEVEVITAGTLASTEFLLLLHGYPGNLFTDDSSYARTPLYTSSAAQGTGPFSGGIYYPGGGTGYALQYSVPRATNSDQTYDAWVTIHSLVALTTEVVLRHETSAGAWTLHAHSSGGQPYLYIDRTGGSLGHDYDTELLNYGQTYHVRICLGADNTFRFFLDGDLRLSDNVAAFAGTGGVMYVGGYTGANGAPDGSFTLSEVAVRPILASTATFTPPTEPFAVLSSWTAATETLDAVVQAEHDRNPACTLADIDVTDLVGVTVTGFKAIGPSASTIAQLADIYYFDVIPGNPIRCQRRGTAAVGTIPFADTGVGVDGPGEPFTGLKRGNNIELPAVVGLAYPNVSQDHEPGYERGDRLTTDGPDVRRIQTTVVLIPTQAKGRSIAATLDARAQAHTATVPLSDQYAVLEPGDTYTLTDDDGNTYNLRAMRLGYADGVKAVDWVLDDTTALVETGITSEDYTPSVTVATAGTAEGLPMDIPLLLDVNDSPGYHAVVKTSDESSARFMESPDDVTYSTAYTYTTDAVFGSVTAVVGSFPATNLWDDGSSITVDVGDGTLTTSTRAALLADRSVNAFAVGVDGRWCLGQFRTATLVSAGIYTLTGLLLGAKGTEQYAAGIIAGDNFCLLTSSALQYLPRATSLLGVAHYWKAVPQHKAASAITGAATTVDGISLKPLSPVRARAARDVATGDVEITWARRTRYDVRFGGDLGDACPLGEASEQYRVRLYTSSAFTTLLRDLGSVTTNAAAYTAAQISADGKVLTDPIYADIRQLSAVVGEGYALQDTL